ncbi:sodium/hydrogen exchanger [Paenibacillus curdlanolyticus YK9]|uniref:Sodium/hydrogen exchanger n=1 Tax=Paenibacillus curdlanolyticus YK9 TaxID=717606 RepID=E0I7F8_9BACL|nr:sodium/hydrogen exchanger [Paenibacillus curdlanolyticus YK9]
MSRLDNSHLILLFFQVALFMMISISAGALARKLGQPKVIGELIGGVVVGSLIAQANVSSSYDMLHSLAKLTPEINGLLQIGMLLFMFIAGLEVNMEHVSRKLRPAVYSSLFGMLLPFALGLAAVFLLPMMKGANVHVDDWTYGSFIGIALSISALPVILKILMDLNLIHTEEGTVILSSATISDLICWTVFSCLISSLGVGGSLVGLLVIVLKYVGFPALLLFIGSGKLSFRRTAQKGPAKRSKQLFETIILIILLISGIAEWLGIHPFFAVFILGVAMRKRLEGTATQSVIQRFSIDFFAPLYFISVGFKVNFFQHFNLLLCVIVIAIACIGKIAGAGIGARIGGMSAKSSAAVGMGMNARGAVEIIIATVALELKVIDEAMFVAIVLMAIFTSIIAGVSLKWLLGADGADKRAMPLSEPKRSKNASFETHPAIEEL